MCPTYGLPLTTLVLTLTLVGPAWSAASICLQGTAQMTMYGHVRLMVVTFSPALAGRHGTKPHAAAHGLQGHGLWQRLQILTSQCYSRNLLHRVIREGTFEKKTPSVATSAESRLVVANSQKSVLFTFTAQSHTRLFLRNFAWLAARDAPAPRGCRTGRRIIAPPASLRSVPSHQHSASCRRHSRQG